LCIAFNRDVVLADDDKATSPTDTFSPEMIRTGRHKKFPVGFSSPAVSTSSWVCYTA